MGLPSLLLPLLEGITPTCFLEALGRHGDKRKGGGLSKGGASDWACPGEYDVDDTDGSQLQGKSLSTVTTASKRDGTASSLLLGYTLNTATVSTRGKTKLPASQIASHQWRTYVAANIER